MDQDEGCLSELFVKEGASSLHPHYSPFSLNNYDIVK